LIGLTTEDFDVPPGGDIILRKIKGGYEVVVVTKKGDKLLKETGLKTEKREKVSYELEVHKKMVKLRKLLLSPELLKDAVEWSWKGYPGVWDRLQNECLGCGICTYVCPLCHCFSIEDKIDLSGNPPAGGCSRCRKWDACTLLGFSRVAGGVGRPGHNFHKSIKERYYNWFYHKFVRGYLEFGKPQCVACGRCQKYCPARIDIEQVLLEIVEHYKKSKT
jgi:formate hydrogenlyase subunit 6/NADH:ubiquinone oxidoreductase subunit I